MLFMHGKILVGPATMQLEVYKMPMGPGTVKMALERVQVVTHRIQMVTGLTQVEDDQKRECRGGIQFQKRMLDALKREGIMCA